MAPPAPSGTSRCTPSWHRRGRLLLDELVTAVYAVEDFEKARAEAESGRVARAVLTF